MAVETCGRGPKGALPSTKAVEGGGGGADDVRVAQTLCETRKTNLISLHQFSLP